MEGLEIFFIASILSAVIFYFISRTILIRKPKTINFSTPFVIITALSILFAIFSLLTNKDGWVIMGHFFYIIAIIAGGFIGTFLPLINLNYRKK